MSVIFFDVEELANVAVACRSRFSDNTEACVKALAVISRANAVAFKKRYPNDCELSIGFSASEIMKAIKRKPKGLLETAVQAVKSFDYNCETDDWEVDRIDYYKAMMLIQGAILNKWEV